MLNSMIRRLLIFVLLMSVFLPLHAADVYMTVDENGNPTFSDQPSENAEKLEIKEVTTIPAFDGRPPPAKTPEPAHPYRNITVVSPKQDETYFRSEGDLVVTVQLTPRLRSSDTLVYYKDGTEIFAGKSSSHSIAEMDRGTHTVSVAVRDVDGNILIKSSDIIFFMKQNSILNRAN